jgi:hypothetical protein
MTGNIYKERDVVFWKWGNRRLKGTVIEVYYVPMEQEIKGSKVKRKGGEDNPAYLISKENSVKYLFKLHSELLNEEI